MSKRREKLRDFIIKVGCMSGLFLGEHNLVHEPTLEALIDELEALIEEIKFT